jgi:hypothetical protein
MLTPAQTAKLRRIPDHLHPLYRAAVAGNRKAAIRYCCIECMGWVASEVEKCTCPACVWYDYRLLGVHAGKHAAASARAVASGRGFAGRPRENREGSAEESPGGVKVTPEAETGLDTPPASGV